jgi:nucleotide-binding universal stress UspA family protein
MRSPRLKESAMLPIRTILHPTDFSYSARYAFDLASALAKDYGARLVVLHVHVPDVQAFAAMPSLPPVPVEDRSEVLARLKGLRPLDPEVPVEYFLRDGPVADEILRLAREGPCDLIVLGTHGRTGLSRLLMGSVAEAVSRKALCPVVTVKAPVTNPASGESAPEKVARTGTAPPAGGRQEVAS